MDLLGRAETQRAVRTALLALSPPQRTALALVYFGGMTQSEIAAHIHEPLGTVKTRMRTGWIKLRGALETQGWGQIRPAAEPARRGHRSFPGARPTYTRAGVVPRWDQRLCAPALAQLLAGMVVRGGQKPMDEGATGGVERIGETGSRGSLLMCDNPSVEHDTNNSSHYGVGEGSRHTSCIIPAIGPDLLCSSGGFVEGSMLKKTHQAWFRECCLESGADGNS